MHQQRIENSNKHYIEKIEREPGRESEGEGEIQTTSLAPQLVVPRDEHHLVELALQCQ